MKGAEKYAWAIKRIKEDCNTIKRIREDRDWSKLLWHLYSILPWESDNERSSKTHYALWKAWWRTSNDYHFKGISNRERAITALIRQKKYYNGELKEGR